MTCARGDVMRHLTHLYVALFMHLFRALSIQIRRWACISASATTCITEGALQPEDPPPKPPAATSPGVNRPKWEAHAKEGGGRIQPILISLAVPQMNCDWYSSIASTYGNKWARVTVYVGVWNCQYSRSVCPDNRPPIFLLYGIVTPVKVTKRTSVRPAADVADESSGLFLREKERGWERRGEERPGGEGRMEKWK